MKKYMNIKWMAVFSLLSFPIEACWAGAPAVDIRVVGILAAPGCFVVAPNNGVYDLGTLPVTSGKSTKIALAPLSQTWRIQCEAETYLKLLATDNRAVVGTSSEPASYGLLGRSGGEALGYYYVEIANATVNGKPARVLAPGGGDSARMRSGRPMGWWQGDVALHSGRLFSADITVYPFLTAAGAAKSRALEGETVDGSMTISFEFGL
ncbi:hypothetical protein D3C79_389140 [compost metagenome]